MSPGGIACIGTILGFILVYLRMPVAFAFGFVGFVGVIFLKGFYPALAALGTIPYSIMGTYTFTVIPLFTLMGYLAFESKFAEEFYRGIRGWLGATPGGLASAVVLGNAAFGACTGDSISAATTFTAMSLPQMRKYGYNDRLSLGAVCAGSVLAQLIPPSFAFILFGIITETSVSKLFMAGIIPGIILIVLYFTAIYLMCRINPRLGPPMHKINWREKMIGTPGMWSLIVIMGVIIFGLYFGIFTPSEAAGVAVFVVLILSMVRRKINWESFRRALEETGLTACMVFFIIIGIQVFNLFLALTGTHILLGNFIGDITDSPSVMLLLLAAVYILLGTAFDIASITLLTLPIFFPVVVDMGIDPVHFGVTSVVATTIGTLSPPFGIIIFAISGVVKDVPVYTIFRGVYPFIAMIIILIILVVFIPQLSLFLPSEMLGK
jgi:C4-dicarboxylate transporter DctM subunit